MRKQVSVARPARTPPRPPPNKASGRAGSWRAPALVALVYVAVVSGVTLPTPLYGHFQDRWSLTNAEVTALYALYPIGVLVVLLTAAHWADLLGRRPVIQIALTASALSSAAFLVASSPWIVAGARVLTGVASGFVVNAANALLVELSPTNRRRSASVASTMVNQIGLGAGALVSAVLVQLAWAPTKLVFGCHLVAMAGAAIALRAVPETVSSRRPLTMRLQPLGLPRLGRRTFLAASLAAFAAFALCGLLAALAPAIVREELGSSDALYSGGAVALVFVVSGVSQVLWVRVSDRQTVLAGAGLLLSALTILVVGVSGSSAPVFFLGVALGGAAVGGIFMGTLSVVNHTTTDAQRAHTTGTYFFITFSGLVVPVVATGVAADHLTQLQATVAFSCVVGAITVVATALLAHSSRRARHPGSPRLGAQKSDL